MREDENADLECSSSEIIAKESEHGCATLYTRRARSVSTAKAWSKHLLTAARRAWGDVLTRSGPETALGQDLPGPDTPEC